MEHTPDEIKDLQSCINDLISLLALPAIWSGRDSARLVSTLLDALVGMLRLDFAYVRLMDSTGREPIEMVVLAERRSEGGQPQEVGRALDRWLTGDPPASPQVVPNPVGEGQLSIAALRLGSHETGLLVAGSRRSEFPAKIEMLLLRVATNQAAAALQEARHLSEHTQAAEELERRVAERIRELTTVNEELNKEIAERNRAEQELRQSEERFRVMVEGVKDYAILMLDPQGRIVTWNLGAEHIKGYRADEAIGRHYSLFYTREDIDRGLPGGHLEMAASEGQLNDEGWRVRKDGSRFWASVVITAIRNEGGALVGFSKVTRDLTERKRTEAYVTYQANLLANVHDAILATDDQFRLTAWNRAAEEMYGWKADEVLGLNVQDVIRSEISATQRSDALKLLGETGHYHAQVIQYRRDGWPLWIQGDTMALRDEAGPITGYVYAFRDVTTRKKAEAEALALKDELAAELAAMTGLHEFSTRLLASTELQPLLEELLDATIALLNADFGNIQLYNPETQMLEIVAHRGFQQDFLDYFSGVQEEGAACGRALRLHGRVIIEDVRTDTGFAPHRGIAASAGFRAVQSTPLFSRGGEPLGMISTHFRQPHRPSEHELRLTDLYARQAVELIERRRAEEILRASEERFRSYFELGLIGMAITSPDKGCIEVNDELCRILGYERRELLRITWPEITHPHDRTADLTNFDRVMAGESDGYTMDKRWIRKDGRIIDTIMAAKCLRRADGSVDYFVGLVQDITERRLAEEALREAHSELAHATRVMTLGELTASIAHEVNQPLAAIVTNGQTCLRLLARDRPDLGETREAVECMISDGIRASEVIKRIRALLKKTAAEKAPLSLNETIQEVLPLASRELARNKVLLRTELGTDLPPVLGDRVQLQQVLLNLILNANEAMRIVERPRELLIRSGKSSADYVVVAVRDSGGGLGSDDVERIFDAFFTTKTKQGGLGLGLSISRTIIEAHGGRLWATLNEDHGATFQFTLPTTDESQA